MVHFGNRTDVRVFLVTLPQMWTDEFLQCLKKSTVAAPLFEKAIALKQQHLPKRIYKYRKDDEVGYARTNLATNTIWLATPDSYNDPYDCALQLSASKMLAAVENGFINVFVTANHLDISAHDLNEVKQSSTPLQTFRKIISVEGETDTELKKVAELVSAMPEFLRTTVEVVKLVRNIAKICSFSAVQDSILMWSHYADNHKGFCVEYDLDRFESGDVFLRNLYPVIYSKEVIDLTPFWTERVMSGGGEDVDAVFVLLGVIQKFIGWDYEQEWRYVRYQEPPNQDRNRSMPLPSRVFLGAKSPPDTTKALLGICEAKNIPVWQMRMSSDKYEMLADPVQSAGIPG